MDSPRFRVDFGKRIKLLRLRFSMTQEMLAERLGKTKNAVATWENGRYVPSLEDLIEISDVLNVSIDWLARGDEPGKVSGENSEVVQRILHYCRELPRADRDAIEAQARFLHTRIYRQQDDKNIDMVADSSSPNGSYRTP